MRDTARPLTEVRDAKILIEPLDGLIEHFREHIADRAFGEVRKALQYNLRSVRQRVLDEQNAFIAVGEMVRQARERIKGWADVPNRRSVVSQALADTYRRACAAFQEAAADPTVEALHEERKQAKYQRYQTDLPRSLFRPRQQQVCPAKPDRNRDVWQKM